MTQIKDLNKNMTILVVDDFSTVRRVVINCLAKLGFKNILEASDAESALLALSKNNIELVISDWNMPSLDGDELLNIVKRDAKLKTLPCLVVISPSQKNEIQKKPPISKSEILVKPFTAEALQAKMEAVFTN